MSDKALEFRKELRALMVKYDGRILVSVAGYYLEISDL